jgi:hypothetical protein
MGTSKQNVVSGLNTFISAGPHVRAMLKKILHLLSFNHFLTGSHVQMDPPVYSTVFWDVMPSNCCKRPPL